MRGMFAAEVLMDLERLRQDAKWDEQNHTPPVWLAIFMEEYGETVQALDAVALCHAGINGELLRVAGAAGNYARAAYGWTFEKGGLGPVLHAALALRDVCQEALASALGVAEFIRYADASHTPGIRARRDWLYELVHTAAVAAGMAESFQRQNMAENAEEAKKAALTP